jgi:hypothetical protein
MYSVTIFVALGFTLAGQLLQMPAAAPLIAKISKLLMQDLQL